MTDLSKPAVRRILFFSGALAVSVFLVHLYFVGFSIYGDGLGYYAPLRSLVFDGNIQVDNEYQQYAMMESAAGGGVRWPHAEIPQSSMYTIGMGLVLSPFFFAGHFTAMLLPGVLANGFTFPYELFYGLGSVLIGMTGLVCTYRACRLFSTRLPSLAGTLAVWFGTPLFYYMTIESSMSHSVSQGLVSLYLLLWLTGKWKASPRQAVYLGVALGLATLVRPQNVLFASTVMFSLLWGLKKTGQKQRWSSAFIAGFVTLVCIFLQVIVYTLVYGTVSESPYLVVGEATSAGSSFLWFKPAVWNVLFSGHRGLFVWHPITILSAAGLFLLAKNNRKTAIALGVALLLQVYLVAAWHCWWQGASFGSRMLVNCNLVFALGAALSFASFKSQNVKIPVLIVSLCVAWNLLIMVQYRSGMIPSEKSISAKTLLYNQAKVIPFAFKKYMGSENE